MAVQECRCAVQCRKHGDRKWGALPDSASAEVEDSIFMFDKSYPVFDNQKILTGIWIPCQRKISGWMVRALMRKAMTMRLVQTMRNWQLSSEIRFCKAIPKALFFLIPVFAFISAAYCICGLHTSMKSIWYSVSHFHTFLFIAILIFHLAGCFIPLVLVLISCRLPGIFWRASMSLCADLL